MKDKSHYLYAIIVLLLGALGFSLTYTPEDKSSITSTFANVGIFLAVVFALDYFYINRKYKVEEAVQSNPIALALYLGSIFLGIAICVTL